MVSVCRVFIHFNLVGFKMVTSGQECQRISNKDTCKKAFKMLDLKFRGDPWPRVTNYGSSIPKGCFTSSARNTLMLNTFASAAECSLTYPCICYDIDCTTTKTTGRWEFVLEDWLRSRNFISLTKGGKKLSLILCCCALPEYVLTIGGGNGVNALSTDQFCDPIKPCMANLGNFPQSINNAVGTKFGT